ncbi:MAG TPA: SPASM domain-containing protein [Kutzneria sp.]|nr:SPASM domain-containing protein [Kutzneria sp.]
MTVWTERRLANRDLNLAERELGKTVLHSRPTELCLQLTENVDGTLPGHTMSEPLFDRVADLFATAETVDLWARGDGPILRRLPRFVAQALESGCGIRLFCGPGMLDSALLRRLVQAEAVVTLTVDPDEALGTEAVMQDLKTLADGDVRLELVARPAAMSELMAVAKHAAGLGVHTGLSPSDTALSALNTAIRDGETPADPWRRLHVDYRGEVGVCDIAVVGNATTSTLLELWNDRKYRELREKWKGNR